MKCVVFETERQPQCFLNAVMPIQGLLLNVGMLDRNLQAYSEQMLLPTTVKGCTAMCELDV